MRRDIGMMAKALAGIGVGDVYFYHRTGDCFYCISDAYRGVGVGGGVECDAIYCAKSGFLNFVDQFAFNVSLIIGEGYLRKIFF